MLSAVLFLVLLLREAVAAVGLASSPPPQNVLQAAAAASDSLDLFGGDAGWDSNDWIAVDDRVRGGSSQSHLEVLDDGGAASFHGVLDTSTLGGAGFASQRTAATNKVWDLSAFDGIEIEILDADGKTYALNLKNELGDTRPDGRIESSVEYKFLFNATTPSKSSRTEPTRVFAAWSDFVPYYRGRPTVERSPVDPRSIRAFSLMIASLFDKQKGPFRLILQHIAATVARR